MVVETLQACPVCGREDRLGNTTGLGRRCERVRLSLTRNRGIRFEEREIARKVLAFVASGQAT